MSLKIELVALPPRPRGEAVMEALTVLVLMACVYYLDHARLAAFGLVPAIGLFTVADRRGVALRTTPRLFLLTLLSALGLYFGALAWVVHHPLAH